ncbi:MAG: hypothetical protein QXO86_07280 [Nitrososphaerota archaeon]
MGMSVISVKVHKSIKERMEKFRGVVDWPEEIRRAIVAKLEELERKQAVEEAVKLLEKVKPATLGTAAELVREDRDSH